MNHRDHRAHREERRGEERRGEERRGREHHRPQFLPL